MKYTYYITSYYSPKGSLGGRKNELLIQREKYIYLQREEQKEEQKCK
jgi:hypothetical protein